MSQTIHPDHMIAEPGRIDTERQNLLSGLTKDRLLPDTQVQLTYHINAFLFVAFFPLGLVLYYYGKVFEPSLRVALTLFAMWWLNFTIIYFLG